MLRDIVSFVGNWASFLIIPLIVVTIFDVTARKLIWIQIFLVEHVSRFFESTLMQELEWHFHTALFALVLGFGTVYNRHVRVDLVREKLQFRKQAWIEFIGTTIGMLPYTAIVIFFAYQFAIESWQTSEISASQVGLEPSLDHQDDPLCRAGDRPDVRRRRLVAAGGRTVRAEGTQVPPDDHGLARGAGRSTHPDR